MFIESGQANWSKVRAELQALLSADNPELRDNQALRDQVFFKQSDVKMHTGECQAIPISIHLKNMPPMSVACSVTRKMRCCPTGQNSLLVMVSASSVIVSGTDIVRPSGQIKLPDSERPVFSACRKLDFELETGFIVGKSSQLGQPVPIENAWDHIFGMVLFNDWLCS